VSVAASSGNEALPSSDNTSQLQNTITNIDLLLGMEASADQTQPPAAAAEQPPEVVPSAASTPVPTEVGSRSPISAARGLPCVDADPCACSTSLGSACLLQWAHLPAQEVSRRQVLVQRRAMLGLRQAELQRECDVQERKVRSRTPATSTELRISAGSALPLPALQQPVPPMCSPLRWWRPASGWPRCSCS
jgi:hypothetical protein